MHVRPAVMGGPALCAHARRPPVLPGLTCPVLVVWGANDRWTPVDGTVARCFARLAEERPERVSFVTLDQCGHVPFDDATEACLASALTFLRRI